MTGALSARLLRHRHHLIPVASPSTGASGTKIRENNLRATHTKNYEVCAVNGDKTIRKILYTSFLMDGQPRGVVK